MGVADTMTDNLQTPLMWACCNDDNIATIRSLLAARADACLGCSVGLTPLIYATQSKSKLCVLSLFAFASTPPRQLASMQDAAGCSTVHWAAYKGEDDLMRVFDHVAPNCIQQIDKKK